MTICIFFFKIIYFYFPSPVEFCFPWGVEIYFPPKCEEVLDFYNLIKKIGVVK